MKATKTLLMQIVTDKTLAMTYEELSEQYQLDMNPSLLATAYVKLYDLVVKTSLQYPGLTQEEYASFTLEKLDMCMLTYQPGKVKFTTYFVTVLKRCFMKETWATKMVKRKAMLYADSYEGLQENGWDVACPDVDFLDENSLIRSLKLTAKQEKYCELLVQGFNNNTIAKMLGVTPMTLCNYRKALRNKISLAAL